MSDIDDTEVPTPPSFVGLHWPGTLIERMGMEVIEHTAQRTVLTMPVEGNRQSVGLLHGGGSAALAETAASLAAQAQAWSVGARSAVGVELSISHLRSTRSGQVTAVATALHLGRTSTVHLVDIRDERGTLISSARVTNRSLGGPGWGQRGAGAPPVDSPTTV
ncbi:MAG: hotdog fold thioesterase [Actinomyces sp.]|nr:hotdog fold thioesterase [Actinomyces sp.]